MVPDQPSVDWKPRAQTLSGGLTQGSGARSSTDEHGWHGYQECVRKSERAFIGLGSIPYEGLGRVEVPGLVGRVAIPLKEDGAIVLGGYASVGFYSLSVGARLRPGGSDRQ